MTDREKLRAMHRRAQKAEGRLARLEAWLDLWEEHSPHWKWGRQNFMAKQYILWLLAARRRGRS